MSDDLTKVAVYNAFVNKLKGDPEQKITARNQVRLESANREPRLQQPFDTVQTGAVVMYKNGIPQAQEQAIYFAQPFVGETTTVQGIRIAAASMNPSMQERLHGKKEGDDFNLPNGTYKITKIL